jgi:hypothetical protein
MKRTHSHDGYIFLISVLVVGVIAGATSTSLMLLGWAAEQNGQLAVQSYQSFANAQTCIERAIRTLRSNLSYGGSGTYILEYGSCTVHAIGGTDNDDRTICATGISGSSTHRLQIQLDSLYPSVIVRKWQEVPTFTLCP